MFTCVSLGTILVWYFFQMKPSSLFFLPQTVHLRVLIHCEACKKKVKKVLQNVEGVQTVEIDGALGKVSVVGNVDACALIKRLERANKVAEVFPSGGGGSAKDKGQQKNGGAESVKEDKENSNVGNDADVNAGKTEDNEKMNGDGGCESGKKKKKSGGNQNASTPGPFDDSMNTLNKSIAPLAIQTGFVSMDSAEYATHMFSDENANNCSIM
ncbi:hypothetical protein KP509_18G044200 [Ceratopteris richardii]|uniref:HMA domain-containing protein n=1 Tax=Ceratopteris richardii TaxID=49495 RepID=A0A8T2STS6_CERRI|nr:hypothetical protein KP509_18G044200 [Ceratopteris richardii]